MKKLLLILTGLIMVGLLVGIYQQHQTIRDYRSLVYSDMAQLREPVVAFLEFHEEAERLSEEERNEQLVQLNSRFADFFNYSGGGVHVEQKIKEEYYGSYNDAKSAYSHIIQRYTDASSPEEREQAITDLRNTFERYNEFLETAKDDLDVPI
ncbi:hypothetical protein [Planomicrobium sp. YIM 101495]|uniref:hypothetical protein n=1 Tax=Planomicrobium sp. YIM 101495 TaxID=2665160 RepID=UPI0012BA2288|nr:hypothetical protein [Planomicrobium sp. YIM 101495]MTD31608.1 hypothetical protein [Planomicrobium sp. YIM 101495]